MADDRCPDTTLAGNPCKLFVYQDHDYCYFHLKSRGGVSGEGRPRTLAPLGSVQMRDYDHFWDGNFWCHEDSGQPLSPGELMEAGIDYGGDASPPTYDQQVDWESAGQDEDEDDEDDDDEWGNYAF